jgi:phosphoribosylformimino-5-aminoimidazole carboxamide ribotide isomerase
MQQVSASFTILPAIDLRAGRVVRLRQGDFGRETAFAEDPVDVATRFVAGGATWLHVVDLDGARAGHPVHAAVIGRILAAIGDRARVEIAGGLRTAGDVARVLDLGATRVVVGTAALADPAFAAGLVATHGTEAMAVALDVRDGFAVGAGWVPGAPAIPLDDALANLAAAGVSWFEVTAVLRDGTLQGPDTALLRRVVASGRGTVIAAGGIASVADIAAVRELGCAGAIVGRALYDGTLDLASALGAGRPGRIGDPVPGASG